MGTRTLQELEVLTQQTGNVADASVWEPNNMDGYTDMQTPGTDIPNDQDIQIKNSHNQTITLTQSLYDELQAHFGEEGIKTFIDAQPTDEEIDEFRAECERAKANGCPEEEIYKLTYDYACTGDFLDSNSAGSSGVAQETRQNLLNNLKDANKQIEHEKSVDWEKVVKQSEDILREGSMKDFQAGQDERDKLADAYKGMSQNQNTKSAIGIALDGVQNLSEAVVNSEDPARAMLKVTGGTIQMGEDIWKKAEAARSWENMHADDQDIPLTAMIAAAAVAAVSMPALDTGRAKMPEKEKDEIDF